MAKRLLLSLLLAAGLVRAAVPSVSLPLDWTTANGISRANLNLNPIALRDGLNVAIDSLNPVLAAFSGWNSSLAIASNQDLILKVDADANGTHKLVVTSNNVDSILRIHEDGTARIFDHLVVDSNITTRKVTAADSLLGPSLTLSGLSASRLVATNAGKTAASVSDLTSWIAGTANQITSTSDGDGTLTLSLPSAITLPGTIAVPAVVANQIAYGDGSNRLAGSANLTWNGTTLAVTGAGTYSSTLGVTGKLTGSDSVVATLGLRVGSDITMYRQGANLLRLGDSLVVDGRFEVAGAISGASTLDLTGGNLTVERSNSGGTVNLRVSNTSNTASSEARLNLVAAGTSAGDAFVRYDVSGTTSWVSGLDNSDGDAFVISESGTPGSNNRIRIASGGAVSVPGTLDVTGAATAASAALGGNEAFTYDEGTFTMTGTGFTSSPTGTARYTRVGTMVVLYIPMIQGVSNSASLTYTGAPASIRPARQQTVTFEAVVDNTMSYLTGFIDVATDGTLTLTPRASATTLGAFTSSGSKGISGLTITYSLL